MQKLYYIIMYKNYNIKHFFMLILCLLSDSINNNA